MNGDEDESSDWSGSLAPFEDDSDAHFGRGFRDSNLKSQTAMSASVLPGVESLRKLD